MGGGGRGGGGGGGIADGPEPGAIAGHDEPGERTIIV